MVARTREGGGTDPTAAAVAAIPGSRSAALLEQERQQMILEDSAAKTLSLVGSPKLATRPTPSSGSSSSGSSSSGSSSSSTGGGGTPNAPPPNPGTAQAIAFNLLPSFGFTPASAAFNCLDPLWNQESGWRWNAENASGAYGIPQALPGSKMASAGADWQTNPRTQIIWGLGYIKSTYGTPCNAWAHEQADGWY